MKVDKQLPAVTPFALDRQTPDLKGVALQRASGATQATERETPRNESAPRQSSTYGLQLNQQLSAMQSASSYLNQVQARLSQLKLKLGRQLRPDGATGRWKHGCTRQTSIAGGARSDHRWSF